MEGDVVQAVVGDHLGQLGHDAGVVGGADVQRHGTQVGTALLLQRLLDVGVPLRTRRDLEVDDGDVGVGDRPDLLADVGDRHVGLVTVVGEVVVDVGDLQLGVHRLRRADQRDAGAGELGQQRHAVAALDDGQHGVVGGDGGEVGRHRLGVVLVVLDGQLELASEDATLLVEVGHGGFRTLQVEALRGGGGTGHVAEPADPDRVTVDTEVRRIGHRAGVAAVRGVIAAVVRGVVALVRGIISVGFGRVRRLLGGVAGVRGLLATSVIARAATSSHDGQQPHQHYPTTCTHLRLQTLACSGTMNHFLTVPAALDTRAAYQPVSKLRGS